MNGLSNISRKSFNDDPLRIIVQRSIYNSEPIYYLSKNVVYNGDDFDILRLSGFSDLTARKNSLSYKHHPVRTPITLFRNKDRVSRATRKLSNIVSINGVIGFFTFNE